jgi:hypothetical protein
LKNRWYSGTHAAKVSSEVASAAQRASRARRSPMASVTMPPSMGSQITTDSKPIPCMPV